MWAVIMLALDAAGVIALAYLTLLNPVMSWLVSASVITFLLFGYDKAIAASDSTRVPERSLLFAAAVGGIVGAIAGMLVWRHKTAKLNFQFRLLAVLVLQAMALALYWLWKGHLPFM